VAVIEAQSVSKQFLLKHNATVELKVRFLGLLERRRRQTVEEFWALRAVSLQVERGEALGLIGRNGSGKSTFLKLIAGIHRPTSGRLLTAAGARVSSMIELGVGFHPELTCRENVFLNAAIHGLTKAEIERIYRAVVEYSGLLHFIDVPIKNYSSGMHMRLAFAIAANLDPDILLLDEIFAVGDADFQKRCIATVKRFLDEGKTIVFVSHSHESVRAICDRVCVLDQGQLEYDGDPEGALAFYGTLLTRDRENDLPPAVREAASHPATSGEADDDDTGGYRQAFGGHWLETGRWQFEFLRERGLAAEHYVIDLGCGSLATAIYLLPFLDEHHYLGVERNRALLEAGRHVELPRAGVDPSRGYYLISDSLELAEVADRAFDYAVATSVFPYLSLNAIACLVATAARKLKPTGVLFATWFEGPVPATCEPVVQAGGTTTYPDREPHHYPFRLLKELCETVGATADRVAGVTTPRGESVLAISPRSAD
jgi:ABC-type polysaccharide/polyol phosphate transport system ATPase subunit/SAM-dependent methyltransferase